MTRDQVRILDRDYFALYTCAAQAGDWPLADAYQAGHIYLQTLKHAFYDQDRRARERAALEGSHEPGCDLFVGRDTCSCSPN